VLGVIASACSGVAEKRRKLQDGVSLDKQRSFFGCTESSRSYVAGFVNDVMARRVRRLIDTKSVMEITNHDREDVTNVVNPSVDGVLSGSVVIDTDARAVIKLGHGLVLKPKPPLKKWGVARSLRAKKPTRPANMWAFKDDQEDSGNLQTLFFLEEIDTSEFIMMPFYQNVGIVMAMKEISEEDDDKLTFSAHVVDPANDPGMFRDALKT
jgi:hypothetical protein